MNGPEFGRTVRRWRERMSPAAAGLPGGSHRRAAGLRREELALLAELSVDYVARLEQGRASNPSEKVVEALGRALRLSPNERTHMFNLAGLVPPGQGTVPTFITPSVRRVLDRLMETPVAVYDASITQLLANPLYVALHGFHTGKERNAVWRNFIGSGSWVRHTPESLLELRTTQAVALRSAAQRYPADRMLTALIAELRAGSELFAELWETATTDGRLVASRKTIDHPLVGAVTLDCDVLTVPGADLTLIVYTAEPEGEDAERLARLAVLDAQTASGSA